MLIVGLDASQVKRLAVCKDKYYALSLGDKIEVTSIKKFNKNTVLSGVLSSNKIEDNLMVRYYPSNVIYFDKTLIDEYEMSESEFGLNNVSCSVDRNTCSVYIGADNKYEINQGVLTLSGILSANGLVEHHRAIYSNSQMGAGVQSKVRILSVGMAGDNLIGLFLVQRERGIAIGVDTDVPTARIGVSAKTCQLRDCANWHAFYIDDWFSKCKIGVVATPAERKSVITQPEELPDKSAAASLLAFLNNEGAISQLAVSAAVEDDGEEDTTDEFAGDFDDGIDNSVSVPEFTSIRSACAKLPENERGAALDTCVDLKLRFLL